MIVKKEYVYTRGKEWTSVTACVTRVMIRNRTITNGKCIVLYVFVCVFSKRKENASKSDEGF